MARLVGYRIRAETFCGPCMPEQQDGCTCSDDEKDENGVCQAGCVAEVEVVMALEAVWHELACTSCGERLVQAWI